MGHVTRKTDWCEIDIDTRLGNVLLSERWGYNWLPASLPAWTLPEKRSFHRRCDLAVWGGWSGRANLTVSGSSPFAQRFVKRRLLLNLDIHWVLAGQHWRVSVTKVPPGVFYQSRVDWPSHQIFLGSHDYNQVTRNLGHGVREQVTVAHEFGHSIKNSYLWHNGDEYPKPSGPASPFVADEQSMMHIGHEVRARHFVKLVEELNKMIPNTSFAVASVK